MNWFMKFMCCVLFLLCGFAAVYAQTPEAMLEKGIAAYLNKDYATSLPLFEQAAQAGNAKAMFYLAESYYRGHGMQRNEQTRQRYVELYLRAAELGNTNAMNALGDFYRKSSGQYSLLITKDNEQAIYWYERAAELGDSNAMASLGNLYARNGELKNPEKAVYWYEKARSAGKNSVITSLALEYITKPAVRNTELGLSLLEEAAASSNSFLAREAARLLALLYYRCTGCELAPNPELAFQWHLKAAEMGERYSMADVGAAYEYGDGVKRDLQRACYWYEKAGSWGEKGLERVKLRIRVEDLNECWFSIANTIFISITR